MHLIDLKSKSPKLPFRAFGVELLPCIHQKFGHDFSASFNGFQGWILCCSLLSYAVVVILNFISAALAGGDRPIVLKLAG